MDKDLSPTVPFTPAGSQSAGTARCCFVTEWEMILIKNRINKLWASLLSQSLEPCILESGAKSIPGASLQATFSHWLNVNQRLWNFKLDRLIEAYHSLDSTFLFI